MESGIRQAVRRAGDYMKPWLVTGTALAATVLLCLSIPIAPASATSRLPRPEVSAGDYFSRTYSVDLSPATSDRFRRDQFRWDWVVKQGKKRVYVERGARPRSRFTTSLKPGRYRVTRTVRPNLEALGVSTTFAHASKTLTCEYARASATKVSHLSEETDAFDPSHTIAGGRRFIGVYRVGEDGVWAYLNADNNLISRSTRSTAPPE